MRPETKTVFFIVSEKYKGHLIFIEAQQIHNNYLSHVQLNMCVLYKYIQGSICTYVNMNLST